MKTKLLLLLILIANTASYGQLFPKNGTVFIDTEIPKIYITIEADSLAEILASENKDSDYEYPATFNFKSSEIDSTIQNIGFRLRGNTSRGSAKKSFKISFNTFTSKGKFYGLEKMNINGEHNDPSIIRSKISFDLFRNAEIPAPRSNHVELYINNEYKGLYINVEHIDEEFVESRFGNKNGNLYKCLWPARLTYIDDNPDSYKLMQGDRRVYDLKTNTGRDDYSKLAEFIKIVNTTEIENFPTELEPIFNVNSFLKYLAIEILTGHWDAYSYNKNNYYIYENTQNGKFEFIPYDLDNTYGIDWFGIDWATRDIYNWSASGNRPLTQRLLQNQVYKDRFSFYMKQFLTEYFNSTVFFPEIDAIKNRISQSAENDNYRTLDYGWSINDFHNSYTQAPGAHVAYGLKPYISARTATANSQLSLNNISPIVSQVKSNILSVNQNFEIFAHAEDEDSELTVTLFYKINKANFQSINMLDNGLGNDKMAGDKIYSAVINQPLSSYGFIEYYINATDNLSQTTKEPFAGNFKAIIPEASDIELYINEFMASNRLSNSDEFGEFNDWIEIYNSGNQSIWLGDKYLSDDINERNKWKMPDRNIAPDEYLLFWADKDEEQGVMHTSFKLSADGEEIGIFDNAESGFAQIDYVQFGLQDTDISLGRLPNGQGDMQALAEATPGFSNIISAIETTNMNTKVSIFPNPVSDNLNVNIHNFNAKSVHLSIINILGKTVFSEKFEQTKILMNFNELNLKSGIYLLKLSIFDANKKIISNTNKKIIFN